MELDKWQQQTPDSAFVMTQLLYVQQARCYSRRHQFPFLLPFQPPQGHLVLKCLETELKGNRRRKKERSQKKKKTGFRLEKLEGSNFPFFLKQALLGEMVGKRRGPLFLPPYHSLQASYGLVYNFHYFPEMKGSNFPLGTSFINVGPRSGKFDFD